MKSSGRYDALSQLLQCPKPNRYMRVGCLGLSATVFLAWQYAARDGSTPFADPDTWRKVDASLPYGFYHRVRRFLDDNFLLKVGDEQTRPWNLLTNAFSHKGLGHFVANTWSMNLFCYALQCIVSPIHFAGIILSSAFVASSAFLAQESQRKFPNRRVQALGMSGITAGIGMATAVLRPELTIFVYGFPVPIWVGLGGFAAWDAFSLDSESSTVGHAAHLGGALTGLLYGLSIKYLGTTYPDQSVRLETFLREMRRKT